MTERLNRPFPWQEPLWRALTARQRDGRLPHALLFTGPAGLGKGHMGLAFGRFLLCESPTEESTACGHCRACRLLQAGSHPDLLVVAPEEEGKAISVDQVRIAAAFQSLKGQYGSRRVIVLKPADRLNLNAANALLKTLEEPAEGVVLILVTSRPMALLPTIRSRCQQVVFPPARKAVAEPWLREQLGIANDASLLLSLSAGAPLAALAWAEEDRLESRKRLFGELEALVAGRADLVTMAAAWQESGAEEGLGWLCSWVEDLIRLKSAASPRLTNPDLQGRLQAFAERLDLAGLFQLLDKVTEAMKLVRGQTNTQLLLEETLLAWLRVWTRAQRASRVS